MSGGRVSGALLVAGTGSDAGKSVVTAGLCRALARRGLRVAPFKAQNMALNSMVTTDGGEIGRAQAMQAAAAGVPAEAAMNPVLLKPGAERTHVVVLGRPYADVTARSYRELKPVLAGVVDEALAGLRARFDVVVCEGAGSPAEVNLRADDIANMGLARAADLPVIVVGDIDRGGVFAHLAGTLAVLAAEDQRLVAGFCVNKFRGDPALLAPGLDWLAATTGRPCLGVLPWRDGLWLDVEDSLDLAHRPAAAPGGGAGDVLTVAVVQLPRTSNVTDVDPLAAEAGVVVRVVREPAELADADLVVLPGSRATVADLRWLVDRGLAAAVTQRARAGGPVLGICGGLQMLGELIDDDVESGAGRVDGLGLLPLRTTFRADKTLGLPRGSWRGQPAGGYEIRHGVSERTGGEEFPGGCAAGSVYGTSWHGIFEHDGFRAAFLAEVAARRGRAWRPSGVSFAAVREARLDALGDLVASHLDVDAVLALAAAGAPAGLPVLRLATAVAAR